MERITKREFDGLPDGSQVQIVWSGSFGRKINYLVRVDKWGSRLLYHRIRRNMPYYLNNPTGWHMFMSEIYLVSTPQA